jgi:hypothetical protein
MPRAKVHASVHLRQQIPLVHSCAHSQSPPSPAPTPRHPPSPSPASPTHALVKAALILIWADHDQVL